MAVNNPRKVFAFRVTITDPSGKIWDQYEVQKFKLPAPKISTATHGAGGRLIETPGMEDVLKATLEKISDDTEDTKAKDWYDKVKKRGKRQEYAKTILVEEMSSDMETVIEQNILIDCFPTMYEKSEFDAKNQSDNMTTKMEFSVGDMK